MESRLHMQSLRHGVMVEHRNRAALEQIRKTDKRFKGARIICVIQAYPSRIKLGKVYELTYG